jgi:hypothetical protein
MINVQEDLQVLCNSFIGEINDSITREKFIKSLNEYIASKTIVRNITTVGDVDANIMSFDVSDFIFRKKFIITVKPGTWTKADISFEEVDNY